ncbi:MAG TPA: hypothetical protein VGK25_12270 [Ignavibacteria bacterium]|jgi:hypothetical protein
MTIYCFSSSSQVKEENSFLKLSTWAILQAVPSPTYFEDRNTANSRLKFGFEWQMIPFSYSFNTNKYLSKVNFFYIKPSKRFSGSAECFFEPALILSDFKYAELKKFMFKTGVRIILPVAQKGEYLSISFGAGYYRQSGINEKIYDGITYEAALFSFFGMLGLKFNYNQNAISRYNIGVYIKYY